MILLVAKVSIRITHQVSSKLIPLSLDVNLGINGYDQSTNVSSLSQAFQSLALEAALPGLKTQLLAGTALKGNVLGNNFWFAAVTHCC